MWKFTGDNVDQVTATMKTWRTSPQGHLPNIESPGPSPTPGIEPVPIPPPEPAFPVPAGGGSYAHNGTGWGPGGDVIGKVLPCDGIPAAFKYQPRFPQDTAPPGYNSPDGKTYLEDALQYWSATPGWPLPSSPCFAACDAACGTARKTGQAACELCTWVTHNAKIKQAGCLPADWQAYCAAL